MPPLSSPGAQPCPIRTTICAQPLRRPHHAGAARAPAGIPGKPRAGIPAAGPEIRCRASAVVRGRADRDRARWACSRRWRSRRWAAGADRHRAGLCRAVCRRRPLSLDVSKLRTPGGLLIAVAVSMAPLAIYGVQDSSALWSQFGKPGTTRDFYVWVKGSWIFMEIAHASPRPRSRCVSTASPSSSSWPRLRCGSCRWTSCRGSPAAVRQLGNLARSVSVWFGLGILAVPSSSTCGSAPAISRSGSICSAS